MTDGGCWGAYPAEAYRVRNPDFVAARNSDMPEPVEDPWACLAWSSHQACEGSGACLAGLLEGGGVDLGALPGSRPVRRLRSRCPCLVRGHLGRPKRKGIVSKRVWGCWYWVAYLDQVFALGFCDERLKLGSRKSIN